MKKLYRFEWDCGRMGVVQSVFVADDADVEAAIGKQVYFGEILGKHSEVEGTLEAGDLTILTEDQVFLEQAEAYGLTQFGYNPLEYLQEAEEEEEDEED